MNDVVEEKDIKATPEVEVKEDEIVSSEEAAEANEDTIEVDDPLELKKEETVEKELPTKEPKKKTTKKKTPGKKEFTPQDLVPGVYNPGVFFDRKSGKEDDSKKFFAIDRIQFYMRLVVNVAALSYIRKDELVEEMKTLCPEIVISDNNDDMTWLIVSIPYNTKMLAVVDSLTTKCIEIYQSYVPEDDAHQFSKTLVCEVFPYSDRRVNGTSAHKSPGFGIFGHSDANVKHLRQFCRYDSLFVSDKNDIKEFYQNSFCHIDEGEVPIVIGLNRHATITEYHIRDFISKSKNVVLPYFTHNTITISSEKQFGKNRLPVIEVRYQNRGSKTQNISELVPDYRGERISYGPLRYAIRSFTRVPREYLRDTRA